MHLQDLPGWPPKAVFSMSQGQCMGQKSIFLLALDLLLFDFTACLFFPTCLGGWKWGVDLFSLCSSYCKKTGEQL